MVPGAEDPKSLLNSSTGWALYVKVTEPAHGIGERAVSK
jgi:hypothetical protein